jgi:hypothetical protein
MKSSSAMAVLVLSALGLTATACGSDSDRSAGRYCTEVGNHLTELNAPSLATQGEVDAMLDAWRTVARSAPIAIQPEWDALLSTMETMSTVVASDPESVQRVVDTARRNEPAADRVIDYTFNVCGATIGEVTPVVTAPIVTAPSTTEAPTTG